MSLLGTLIDFGTLGIVDGQAAVGGLQRSLGLESEETALARIVNRSQRDLELTKNRAAKEQIAAQQAALQNRGLIDAHLSMQQIAQQPGADPADVQAAQDIERQYLDAVRTNPAIAQGVDLIGKDNIDTGLKEEQLGGIREKRAAIEAEAQQSRLFQASVLARRTGGKNGAEALGLPPGTPPELVLQRAEQVALQRPNKFPEAVQTALVSIGVDPSVATPEEAREAMRLASERRMDERRAGAARMTQNMSGGKESFVPTGDPLLDRIRQLPKDLRADAMKEWKVLETRKRAFKTLDGIAEESKEFGATSSALPATETNAKMNAYKGVMFKIVKDAIGERMSDKDAEELIIPYQITPQDLVNPARIDAKINGLKRLVEQTTTPTLDAITGGDEARIGAEAKSKARAIFGGGQ